MYYNEKHAKAVKQRGDNYQYIGTYKRNEKLISTGKILGVDIDKGHNKAYIRVTCGYCGNNYDVSTQGFNKGLKCPNCCHNYENSFAYYIQEELKEPLNKYWDWEKNTVNPYLIYKYYGKKVWIKCTKKDYHGSYEIKTVNFIKGDRCSFCSKMNKIHKYDSFGYLYPLKAKQWDYSKNDKTPYEVSPHTGKKYWFICDKCGKSIQKSLNALNKHKDDFPVVCCSKVASRGEEKIKEILNKYKWEEGIDYFTQKTFLNLKGIKRELSYDFYFPKQKILLEYQGEFHDGTADVQNELGFIVQSKNDKKKFNYALEHDYIPMEIWYWDYDNIEEILIRELDLH